MFEEQSNAKQLIKINEIPGLSIETIKKNVQALYQTQGDIVIEPVLEGVANTVFLIKTDSKPLCVLKSFSYKSFSEVEDMCHVTERLRESDFPIPKVDCVIPTTSERGIMFMQHTVGTHKEIGEKERNNAASLMVRLHRISMPSKIEDRSLMPQEFEKFFEKCKSWERIADIKEVYSRLEWDYLKDLPTGLIHGDFSPSNLLFNHQSEVTGLLDFDNVQVSYLLTDIARSQIFFGFNSSGELQKDNIINFVRIYNSERPLTFNELFHFYDHLRFLIIDVALHIYYRVNVAQDLDPQRFKDSKSNNAVNPELLYNKLMNIRAEKHLDISLNKI